MASINSLMGGSSSSSSIYGTRNVISGLASGLDTESLIENAVSGYKSKITSLQQERTKVGWKQDAYRSMIDKMVGFSQKYTSYTSGTNLLSSTFFDSAVNVKSLGENAEKVVASGRTSSDVVLNSVTRLASAARYSTKGNLNDSALAADSFDITGDTMVGHLSGTMTLGYGSRTVQISFKESDIFYTETVDGKEISGAQKMADAINKKLEEETIAFDGGTQEKASERIKAVVDVVDGKETVSFQTVKEKDGNGVWISDTSSKLKEVLGISIPTDEDKKRDVISFNFTDNASKIASEKSMIDLIAEKGFSITVNDNTESVKGPTKDEVIQALMEKDDLEWKFVSEEEKKNAYDSASKEDIASKYMEALDKKLKSEGILEVKVSNAAEADQVANGKIQFKFEVDSRLVDDPNNVTFQVTSDAAKQLHMEGGLTSYVNTSRKLNDLLKATDEEWKNWRVEVTLSGDDVAKAEKLNNGDIYTTANGLRVKKEVVDDETHYYQVDSEGKDYYAIKINDDDSVTVTKETTLDDLIKRINNSDTSEIKASYSSFTGKFTFTAKETGADSEIEFTGLMKELFGSPMTVTENSYIKDIVGEDVAKKEIALKIGDTSITYQFNEYTANGQPSNPKLSDFINYVLEPKLAKSNMSVSFEEGQLIVRDKTTKEKVDISYGNDLAEKLFSGINSYSAGQDAEFNVTVNGENRTVTRNSNTIDIDGMSLTLKGKFTEGEAVTFNTEADVDKIVNAVKQMVTDFNAMTTEIKNAYSTMPLQNSSGKYYEPLTEEDEADMSESAIKAYEEKAKTGLLFADRDLSNLYEGLRSALSELGVSGNDGSKIGITTSYSNGLTTIALDESALRTALTENPDKVRELFTKSKSNGSSSDGLMQGIKTVLDRYAATTGAVKGILIQKAGSALAPTSIYQNTIQTQLNNLDTQIEKWQDKISDQIDYYTTKFTALEKMMAQMNNQSSMLMGLSGGY